MTAGQNIRMKRWVVTAIIGVLVAAPLAVAGGSPRYCGGGSGGAFRTRVIGLSCRYAAYVTENGLRPDLRSTRVGNFRCTRRRSGSGWSYACSRAQGRQRLSFNTY